MIFVDTCSFIQKDSEKTFGEIAPKMIAYKKKIIMLKSVQNEISKHLYYKNPKLKDKFLVELDKADLIEMDMEFDSSFADNDFQTLFTKLRLKYKLCLITNDFNLSKDILCRLSRPLKSTNVPSS